MQSTIYRGYDIKPGAHGWLRIERQGRFIAAVLTEKEAQDKIDEFKRDRGAK